MIGHITTGILSILGSTMLVNAAPQGLTSDGNVTDTSTIFSGSMSSSISLPCETGSPSIPLSMPNSASLPTMSSSHLNKRQYSSSLSSVSPTLSTPISNTLPSSLDSNSYPSLMSTSSSVIPYSSCYPGNSITLDRRTMSTPSPSSSMVMDSMTIQCPPDPSSITSLPVDNSDLPLSTSSV